MVLFESIQSKYFKDLDLKLSLRLDEQVNIMYHNDQKILDEIINIFNNQHQITYGSLIIDDILIQDLEIKERNDYFYNYISFCTSDNLSLNLSLNNNIQQWSKLFLNHYDQSLVKNYLQEFNLINYQNIKLKKIDENNYYLISLLLSLLKKPKLIIAYHHPSIDLKKLNRFLLKNNINTQIILLTNQYIKNENYHFYDLTLKKYYDNNSYLTFYTKQEIFINHKRKFKNDLNIFWFIFKKLQIKNIVINCLFMFFSLILLAISLGFNYINNQGYNYAITYILIALVVLLQYYFSTYQIFFKNKQFLVCLNMEGLNYIFIVLSSILTNIIINLVPITLSSLVIIIFKFSFNFMDNVDISNMYIIILTYLAATTILSFLSSIRLRIDINNNK